MLYLDTLDNFGEKNTQNQFVICHKSVKGLRNILELTPATELLQKWENKMLAWEEFQQAFKAQLREEYDRGEKSLLRRLANYCLENDVVIYSPESFGKQTYRAVLADVINNIWKRAGETMRVIDKATESANGLTKVHRAAMERTADTCKYFQSLAQNQSRKSCFHCAYLDTQVYSCGKLNKLVIPYEWI